MSILSIESIPVEKPFSAILVHCGKYRLNAADAAPAKRFTSRLLDIAGQGISRTVFLQEEYLANAKSEFSSHVQQWRPESGLGVWPDREPPRLWKTTDLFRMARGEKIPLMYRVFRITAGPAAGADALATMAGTGLTMALVHSVPVEALLKQYKDTFLPRLTEPTFRIFPFYVPLLDLKSIRDRKAQELTGWLGSARLYLRESPQDSGLLVVTTLEMQPLISAAGARQNDRGAWIVE